MHTFNYGYDQGMILQISASSWLVDESVGSSKIYSKIHVQVASCIHVVPAPLSSPTNMQLHWTGPVNGIGCIPLSHVVPCNGHPMHLPSSLFLPMLECLWYPGRDLHQYGSLPSKARSSTRTQGTNTHRSWRRCLLKLIYTQWHVEDPKQRNWDRQCYS